jgi:hypothetical protein
MAQIKATGALCSKCAAPPASRHIVPFGLAIRSAGEAPCGPATGHAAKTASGSNNLTQIGQYEVGKFKESLGVMWSALISVAPLFCRTNMAERAVVDI